MVLHNPNNWHWVNKDASAWTKTYLEKNLVGIEAEDGGVSAKINKLVSMDGDVDVNQRKGKVVTIFDVKVVLEYNGKTSSGEEVGGTITTPEVAHDTEENEYVFDIDIYADALSKSPVKDLLRSKVLSQLRTEYAKLGPALVAEHGKDIQHAPGQDPSKGLKPAVLHPPTGLNATANSSTATSTTKKGTSVNTTTVTSSEEFRAPASELYQTFTDPQRIAAFTRAPPKLFEGSRATVGGKFELFGGNVSGQYLELEEPKKIVQSWRLKEWPAEHFSRLEITFDQNDVDNVTVMRVEWSGVPIGQEEVTRRNWGEYYVRSIKQTFGFGTLL